MENDLLHPHSVWSATANLPVYPPLSANLDVEVCVIGAGIAGLTNAYLLARQGVSVAVIEALDVGAGETSHTTAHIAIPDEGYAHLEHSYGGHAARIIAGSFAAAADLIETTVHSENIECEFERVDGYLFSCAGDPGAALRRESAAARRAGVEVVEEERLPVATLLEGPCLRFPRQAQFHPLLYLNGLARAIEQRRGRIFCGTRALEIAERDGGVTVRTARARIVADAAIVATNTPFNDRIAIHMKQNAYQTYVLAALVKRGLMPHVLLWDDADPYHYVRLAPAGDEVHDLLIVGGADHKTGQEPQPQQHYRELEAWLRSRFPQAGPLAYRWSGEVLEPLDGVAYLGRNPGSRNVYVITGDSGNGITHGTIGAMLISDLIMGRQNDWLAIYDPARKPLRQTLQFIREQSNIAAQYTGWMSGGDEPSAAALGPGEGALIRSGLKMLAVYRDDAGALHCRSAKCPHLGCIVQWNWPERTWDCPCHGSRFSPYGSVLHGPAVTGLAAVDEADWVAIMDPFVADESVPPRRRRPDDSPPP